MQPTIIAGRYEVERALGHGATGTVWLCHDTVLGRRVAVKQVGRMPGETSSDLRRALREARSSAALDHPNVVSVFDAVEDGEDTWLVMEYVASRTLAEIIAEEGPLTPERAARIGAQAADGLAATHARGTMHRDVKPANILVGDGDRVKITDFGISRTHGDTQLTSTGLITGTPAYFAPEIARGEEAGLAADVWALGASLYAAVEGRPPYPDQGNPLALLTTIATRSAPLPRRAGVLTEAINQMMTRDPARRWSIEDAALALRRLHAADVAAADVADEPGPARAEPYRTRPLPRAEVPIPAGPPPEPEPEPEPAREPGPEPAPGRRRRVVLVAVVAVLVAGLVLAGLLLAPDDEAPSAAPAASATPSATPTPSGRTGAGSGTDDDSPEPTAEPTPPPTPRPTPTTTPSPRVQPPAPAGDVEEFGATYYGLLPDDTTAAYALLAPSYGTSFEAYDGFWRTIDALTVRGVRAVDDTTVDVDLTYVTDRGSEDETRRLFLRPVDGGFEIVDDTAI